MSEQTIDQAIYNIEEEGEISMTEINTVIKHFTTDHREANGEMVFVARYKKEMFDYLLFKLATIERDTAEKCAEISENIVGNGCDFIEDVIAEGIRDHFSLGEKT